MSQKNMFIVRQKYALSSSKTMSPIIHFKDTPRVTYQKKNCNIRQ